jgi:predicted RNA-binding Zn ribbon-like protein
MTEVERAHRKQLQKIAALTHRDLKAQSPSDFVKIQADLHEFLSGAGLQMLVPLDKVTAEEIMKTLVPSHYVTEMLDELRETLKWLVVVNNPNVHTDPERPGTISLSAEANVTLTIRTDSPSTPFRSNFAMEPGREAAKWALLYHLAHSGLSTDRVLLCPREGCLNVFVLGSHARTDRMRYCSVKCSRIAAIKAYREREAEKKARAKRKQKRRRK